MARRGRFGTRGREAEAAPLPARMDASLDAADDPDPMPVASNLGWYGLVAATTVTAFVAGHFLASAPPPRHLVAMVAPQAPATELRATLVALPSPSARIVERQFSMCGGGRRVTCVVDGDTVWLEGVKIRIADINTPEVSSPACAAEARLAGQATRRLRELLNEGPFEVRAGGPDEDRFGRKLRTFHRNGGSLGDRLVAEGLAHPWRGRKQSWCG